MANQLSERDIRLLDANNVKRVGDEPYEDGYWGSQGIRDFVHFQILDSNNNLIQYENLPVSDFVINNSNKNIEFYPGNHIRKLGFESGTFTIKYNFLRKLAGHEAAVLVHTIDKNNTKIGDVYANTNNIYITEDGIVYAGTEGDYKLNPTAAEQLAIEDLKYQIDEISPNRTEVRLKAKKINGSYADEFVDIQTSITSKEIQTLINFEGNAEDSTVLSITPDVDGFVFTNMMLNGTVSIPDVYKVNEIDVPVKTGINILKNPNGELIETDNLGNILNLQNNHEWDSTLHDDAVKASNWSDGFQTFTDTSNIFYGTTAIGYHAKWVQNQGIAGGVCMVFPDQNEMFEALNQWPDGEMSRELAIFQEMPNLQGQGVKRGDIVNISLDVRSTVAGKGVQLSLTYANELATENEPSNPPEGYFDPNNPEPTELIPTSPPEGYSPNTEAAAYAIEDKPPASEFLIRSEYGGAVPTPFDIGIGEGTVIWGGANAWKLIDDRGVGNPNNRYLWGPNLATNSMNGTLSTEGQWIWAADPDNPPYSYGAWIQNPTFANAMVPPSGVTGIPDAINFHPAQDITQGAAFYPRNTARGENSGWQTACNVGNNAKSLLFKDDLIWEQKHGAGNIDNLKFYYFDTYFNGIRDLILEEGTVNQRTLYDDIFRFGFIQSVDRVSEGYDEGFRTDWFIVFYNNGDRNSNGDPTENSNRFFFTHKSNGVQERQNKKIHFLKDVDGPMNQAVLDNERNLETFSKIEDKRVKYYFYVNDVYYSKIDGDDKGDIYDGTLSGPNQTSDGFGDVPDNLDAIIGKSQGYSRYYYIKGDQIYKSKGTTSDGPGAAQPMTDNFYKCGMLDAGGNELTYGIRNPGASNYVIGTFIYDDGTGEFVWPDDPTKAGSLSQKELWKWDGTQWIENSLMPPRYSYTSPNITKALAQPNEAGKFETINVGIPVSQDWLTSQKWYLYIYGHDVGGAGQGTVWVDNMYVDFTLVDESTTVEVFKPYSAQIVDVYNDGRTISVNKSFREKALEVGVEDADTSTVDVYDVSNPGVFDNFSVSYTNINPKDLRTYLKFDNDLFLTTNFKQDRINVTEYPNSVVYKLYEPLPDNFVEFNECIIVKEMANVLEESISIIDFIPEEEPRLVLKSPDLKNVESPIQRRETLYNSESGILTVDSKISSELRNEFLSQSLDSVEINTDYSRYENFINFSSIEKRIRNFKTKLEYIEEYKISSGSYVGVSGSSTDLNIYHHKIEDIKNNLDDFETYMYFESSSYVSGSLGQFYDNAWPKSAGSGVFSSPYILAHTTSSQADTWFSNAMTSASLYDLENNSKLSSIIPEFIKFDSQNEIYLRFTDMIGQHFDHIWEYVNALSHTFDRRDKLNEGVSKDLLYNVAKSLGWSLSDGKDLINLPRYALGKEVTGSAYSDYSATSERDISREIWSRIINNMPFFLKNKGTVRALKGLINIYGIPSTILRVKEYGGPDLPDNATPQFEITRKFTKALDFKGSQYVKVAWADDSDSSRKPDTVEFRFRAATGSNQILVEKQDANNQDWFIRLKDNGSTDNYGQVSFMLSGSAVGQDIGQYKEITSTSLPVYDGDFYSVMVARTSGSSNTAVSQSYQLNVGKYDASRSKIHLYSTSTMDVTVAPSSSFSNAWTGSGDIYIGGSGSAGVTDVGVAFSGSIMEYRHWTETLQTSSFKNHIANPKAYDGNTISSSYSNLVLRYSFDDNKNLNTDTAGIRDVSSNQTTTLSGSHSGFTGNFFRNVVDELKTHIPSIGALRRVTNKVRIEANKMKSGYALSSEHRATDSAYDTAPNDSNKVGIWFAPTDVINSDIINSVGNLNFDNYIGDPRDRTELSYRGLNYVADNYWKKYTSPNNFWDYMRLIRYYDQSMYPQLRKLIPARAKPDIGLLIEPNIFERPKVVVGKAPDLENTYYSSSINLGNMIDGLIVITGSFNAGLSITDYEAYTGRIDMYSYETGSSVVSASGENLLKEASGSEARDVLLDRSIWQRLGEGIYSNVTMSFGDTPNSAKSGPQTFVSGSRIYGLNQKTMNFYTSSADALIKNANSSSFKNTDLDNFVHLPQALRNSFYEGVKNTEKTTSDGNPPIEVIISAPTKLVTTDEGESTLKTGDGIIPDFKEPESKEEKQLLINKQKRRKTNKGLKGLGLKPETDSDRKKVVKQEKYEKEPEKQEQIVKVKTNVKKNTNNKKN